MGAKGIFFRQTGDRIIFRESLKDSSGVGVTSGTTSLRIWELQTDATLKQYDFNDNTFKTSALTTATASMTHQTSNNSTYNTGIWTYNLTTVTGFTIGNVYIYSVNNTTATPPIIEREFQYGGFEGDFLVSAGSTGQTYLQTDTTKIVTSSSAASILSTMHQVLENGTAQGGASSSITLRAGASSTNSIFVDQVILITGGTGSLQTNRITAYNGTSKAATVETAWVTTPDGTSTYVVLGRIG